MLKSARSTRLSTHNPRQRDRQAGPSGSPGPTGQPTGGRGWPCPAGFSPAVRSPAVWLLPTDSTRGGAPTGATCAARGPPEQGDRRSWRAVALQGGGAGLIFDSNPNFWRIIFKAKFVSTNLEQKGVHKHFLKHLNRILKNHF